MHDYSPEYMIMSLCAEYVICPVPEDRYWKFYVSSRLDSCAGFNMNPI